MQMKFLQNKDVWSILMNEILVGALVRMCIDVIAVEKNDIAYVLSGLRFNGETVR